MVVIAGRLGLLTAYTFKNRTGVANHRYFFDWLGPDLPGGPSGVPALKQRLARRGVNSRGWRLYLEYGDDLLAPLAPRWFKEEFPHNSVMHAADYLKLLQACEMDVPPPLALAESLRDWEMPDQLLTSVPPLFFRAAWKATARAEYAGDDLEDFVDREVVPLAHWFFQSGAWRSLDANQLKAGWDSLLRQREAWLAQQRRQGARDWEIPVKRVEWDAFQFVGLLTERELEDEGSAMQHCVGDYGTHCRDASLCIYSVRYRRTGKRAATISVRMLRDGRWEVDQLKGFRNSDVEERVWRAVPALLTSLEQASLMSPGEWIARFRSQSVPSPVDEDEWDCIL